MAVSDTLESTTCASPKLVGYRIWFLFATVVVMSGASIWYLQLPVQLTAAESQLTGTWTFPLPPNPPLNAVQQIYEMRSDRTIVKYGQPVATGVRTVKGKGTWRLDGEMLVWKVANVDYSARIRAFMDGRSSSYESRMRYLGVEGDSFWIEATDGSKAQLRKFSIGP